MEDPSQTNSAKELALSEVAQRAYQIIRYAELEHQLEALAMLRQVLEGDIHKEDLNQTHYLTQQLYNFLAENIHLQPQTTLKIVGELEKIVHSSLEDS